MYSSVLEWKNSSNFAFLKYEELVGEKVDKLIAN